MSEIYSVLCRFKSICQDNMAYFALVGCGSFKHTYTHLIHSLFMASIHLLVCCCCCWRYIVYHVRVTAQYHFDPYYKADAMFGYTYSKSLASLKKMTWNLSMHSAHGVSETIKGMDALYKSTRFNENHIGCVARDSFSIKYACLVVLVFFHVFFWFLSFRYMSLLFISLHFVIHEVCSLVVVFVVVVVVILPRIKYYSIHFPHESTCSLIRWMENGS